MPHTTSQTITERIEELYGAPLADLQAHADAHPGASMLTALLDSRTALELAERNVDFQVERLRQLADPEREIGPFDAGHILDCARRITESVAARDAHTTTTSAVLQSLRRTPAPEAQPPTATAPPAPAPTPSAVRTR
ncbi:hypothetical protein [Streptomyces pinistramenti]|uniref:hypothetical protein n=1 Tax=Streptomyces pinistramenti TaxID=2884812 RepID=UPI001D062439|nr:hypothetical protein [Streptomyces pinistramenti]MCB5905877.1 hypothetical protein [Streptomyces pinistramenti]